jgi:nicotinate phosphoribosyltransferase
MFNEADMPDLKIVASNQIDEEVLLALKAHGAEIDVYGIGTNLVTAEKDPALGGVYKLVAVDGEPRIKLTQEAMKIPLPGRKLAYRLVGAEGFDLADVLTLDDEPAPAVGQPYLCRHPFLPEKRVLIVPSEVVPLHEKVFDAGRSLLQPESLMAIRDRSRRLQRGIRPDHRRTLNPTPYKVSLSERLFDYMHELIRQKLPVRLMK